MLKETLIEYGLKPKQAKIYLELLKKDNQSAQELADSTNLIRQIVYDQISGLIELGLVTVYIEGKTRKYQANNPETLISSLDQKKEQIKSILPKLNKLKNAKKKESFVRSFKGIKGIKNLLYSTLEENTPLMCIINFTKSHEMFQEHIFYNYTLKRIEKKIPLYILIEPVKISKPEIKIWKTDPKSFRKTKIHPLIKNIPSMYMLTKNKIVILNLDKNQPNGVLIEDPEMFQSQKAFFDLLWHSGKKY